LEWLATHKRIQPYFAFSTFFPLHNLHHQILVWNWTAIDDQDWQNPFQHFQVLEMDAGANVLNFEIHVKLKKWIEFYDSSGKAWIVFRRILTAISLWCVGHVGVVLHLLLGPFTLVMIETFKWCDYSRVRLYYYSLLFSYVVRRMWTRHFVCSVRKLTVLCIVVTVVQYRNYVVTYQSQEDADYSCELVWCRWTRPSCYFSTDQLVHENERWWSSPYHF